MIWFKMVNYFFANKRDVIRNMQADFVWVVLSGSFSSVSFWNGK